MPRGNAVLSRRLYLGEPTWGMDCPEGFAPTPKRSWADRMVEDYNNGDHNWSFEPIHECPKVKNENPT